MIWRYWNTRQLQSALDKIDPELYDNLLQMLPSLSGESYDPTEIDSKDNLVKIFMSFAPSDYFSKKENMELCLIKLPPKVMREFSRIISKEMNILIDHKSFDKSMASLLSIKWSNKIFSSNFINYFSLPEHFLPPEVNKVPSFVDIYPIDADNPPIIATPFKNLIHYQSQVYMDSMRKLSIPRSRFIIQMPTGSGKTRTTMEIISNHLKNSKDGEIVVWLAHSRELCEQAFQCFIEVWQYLSNKPLKAVRCWGDHPIPSSFDKSMFIVGGFQKIHSLISRNEGAFNQLTPRIGLIVIDEAHKAVAPTYKNVISSLKSDNTNVIGLTATPGRSDIEETEEMANFFFESKVNIRTSSGDSEIKMLKAEKVLAHVDYIPIKTPLDFELSPSQRRSLEKTFDFPKGFLKKIASSNIRNIEILKRLLLSCKEDRKILFFSCSVKHSQFIVSMLIYYGINAAHVDGSTSTARREQVIQDFKMVIYKFCVIMVF
jgi:superfamily II DNA or RNA helicase